MTKSKIIKDIAQSNGINVMDIAVNVENGMNGIFGLPVAGNSSFVNAPAPELKADFVNLPSADSLLQEGENGQLSFNWDKMGREINAQYGMFDANIDVISAINLVLAEYHDVFFPRNVLTQKRIDEIEAQGGFDEEE